MQVSSHSGNSGIHSLGRLGIICFIAGLTLAYSLYQKRWVQELISSPGPILQKLPTFQLKEFQKEALVNPERLLQGGNKLVMVHFWGTWCAPCKVEFPGLIRLAKKFHSQELKVLLLAVRDEPQKMEKYLRRFGQLPDNILVAHDSEGMLLPLFGTVKVPETYLFNSKGKNLRKFIGPQDWTQLSYEGQINFYLSTQKR